MLAGAVGSASPQKPLVIPNMMQTPKDYVEQCKHSDEDIKAQNSIVNFACLAWTDGFVSGLQVMDKERDKTNTLQTLCAPPNTNNSQYIHSIKNFIEGHPELAHASLRLIALGELIHFLRMQTIGRSDERIGA
jgi:hypothetical protein